MSIPVRSMSRFFDGWEYRTEIDDSGPHTMVDLWMYDSAGNKVTTWETYVDSFLELATEEFQTIQKQKISPDYQTANYFKDYVGNEYLQDHVDNIMVTNPFSSLVTTTFREGPTNIYNYRPPQNWVPAAGDWKIVVIRLPGPFTGGAFPIVGTIPGSSATDLYFVHRSGNFIGFTSPTGIYKFDDIFGTYWQNWCDFFIDTNQETTAIIQGLKFAEEIKYFPIISNDRKTTLIPEEEISNPPTYDFLQLGRPGVEPFYKFHDGDIYFPLVISGASLYKYVDFKNLFLNEKLIFQFTTGDAPTIDNFTVHPQSRLGTYQKGKFTPIDVIDQQWSTDFPLSCNLTTSYTMQGSNRLWKVECDLSGTTVPEGNDNEFIYEFFLRVDYQYNNFQTVTRSFRWTRFIVDYSYPPFTNLHNYIYAVDTQVLNRNHNVWHPMNSIGSSQPQDYYASPFGWEAVPMIKLKSDYINQNKLIN